MKIARIAVLGIALSAAAGAAFLANTMINNRPVEVVEKKAAVPTAKVLVASRDLALGAALVESDLVWQEWPENLVSPRFITEKSAPQAINDYKAAIVRSSILSGEPIIDQKIVRSDRGGFMSAILPAGMRAVSTKISPETGAGGFILPNDRVDVLLTKRQAKAEGQPGDAFSTETILRNIRILAIDQAFAEEDGKQVAVGRTATLELSPEQSELLALAHTQGELSLALRSLADAGEEIENERKSSRGVNVVRFGIASQVTTTR